MRSKARCAEDSSQGTRAAWLFGYAAMVIIEYDKTGHVGQGGIEGGSMRGRWIDGASLEID